MKTRRFEAGPDQPVATPGPVATSSDHLVALYKSLPIAACLIDHDKNFLAANDRYAQLMGYPLAQIVGGNMVRINPPEHIHNVERDFRTFAAGGTVPDHEIIFGDAVLLVSVNPFPEFRGGAPAAISVTLQDITAHKRMERELLEAKRRIEDLALTDPLTGLPNRRSFEDAIEREIGISRRHGTPLSVAMVDVDAFKAYNDLYGHILGDTCLATIARTIADGLRRPGDLVARYGGEEFVVILPHTTANDAATVMEAIRRRIEADALPHAGTAQTIVTASFGIAGLDKVPLAMSTPQAREHLLTRADAALYRAKSEGRNRVLTATP